MRTRLGQRLAAIALGTCAMLSVSSVVLYFRQAHMLYAGASPEQRDTHVGQAGCLHGLNGDSWGWVLEPAGEARATVVFMHGNATSAQRTLARYADKFTSRGYRAVFLEYPGYGDRPGTPTRNSVVTDAKAFLHKVAQLYPGPLLVAGESLGSGIAALSASSVAVDRVVLFTPWNRMLEVAAMHFPWLPIPWMPLDDYDSAQGLEPIRESVYLAYAADDKLIPASQALRLAERLRLREDRVLSLPGAGHNTWLEFMSAADWDKLFPRTILTSRSNRS